VDKSILPMKSCDWAICLGTKLPNIPFAVGIINEGQEDKIDILNLKISKPITGKGSRRTWGQKAKVGKSRFFEDEKIAIPKDATAICRNSSIRFNRRKTGRITSPLQMR